MSKLNFRPIEREDGPEERVCWNHRQSETIYELYWQLDWLWSTWVADFNETTLKPRSEATSNLSAPKAGDRRKRETNLHFRLTLHFHSWFVVCIPSLFERQRFSTVLCSIFDKTCTEIELISGFVPKQFSFIHSLFSGFRMQTQFCEIFNFVLLHRIEIELEKLVGGLTSFESARVLRCTRRIFSH